MSGWFSWVLRAAALARLETWHREHPGTQGLGERQILTGSGLAMAPEIQAAVSADLVREGALVKTELGLRLPTHQAHLAPADARLWERIDVELAEAGSKPLAAREIAQATGLELRRIEVLLTQAARLGLVHYISKSRVTRPEDLRRLAGIVEQIAMSSGDGAVSVAELRDASGIGRNMSVEIMEYFDKQRFTQRFGDRHRVLKPAEKLFH